MAYNADEECETSFQTLLRMMNSTTYLAPNNPKRKTHLVTEASPCGIATSLYQEDDQGKWVPVDHTSRALSAHKEEWDSQIDCESLALERRVRPAWRARPGTPEADEGS